MKEIKQILSFVFLIALQILVLNNIFFAGYLNPYIYLIFILFLPVKMPKVYVLLLAFIAGMLMDLFENSGGVHIAATVLLAYLRLGLLKLATRKRGIDFDEINIYKLDFGNLMFYAALGVLVHHLTLFTIENYSYRHLGTVLARTTLSSIFTLLFILLWRLWNIRKKV